MTKPARIDWTPALDAQLRSLYPHSRTSDVAVAMGLPKSAVQARADRLGVRKTPEFRSSYVKETTKARSPWSPELEEVLALMYPHCHTNVLVELFGMPRQTIASKVQHMGLRKTKGTRTKLQQDACRQRLETCPESFTFQNGMTPWNKGLKVGSYPGAEATQFKRGNTPATTQPVGTLRLRKVSGVDNVLMQKTDAPNTWRPVHTLVWEEFHGKPWPRGHVMTFADDCRHNLQPTNLVAVSRGDFALRVSPMFNQTLPPELLYLNRLRGVLTRTIDQAARRAQRQPPSQPTPQPRPP